MSPPSPRLSLLQARAHVEDAVENIGRRLIAFGGPIYVLLANCIIGFIGFCMYFVVFPKSCSKIGWACSLHITLFSLILFHVLSNYLFCIRNGPGHPTKLDESSSEAVELFYPGVRKCDTCRCIKPQHCHHCSICNKCILRMDHHCPWMNACIGKRNYRFFLRFLIAVWFGTLYTGIMSFLPVKVGYRSIEFSKKDSPLQLVCMFMSFSVFVGISLLLSFHLFLSFSGLTTIDFMERWMPEEGDDRSRWYTVVSSQELKFSNFKERIGASGSWWCLRCLLPPLPLGWLPRNIHKAKTRGPTIIDPFFGSKF